MTRIFVQRGSVGSSSNANRPPSSSAPQSSASQAAPTSREEDLEKQILEDQSCPEDSGEQSESTEDKTLKHDESSQGVKVEGGHNVSVEEEEKSSTHDVVVSAVLREDTIELRSEQEDSVRSGSESSQIVTGGSYPPPPPAPPPKPLLTNPSSRRTSMGSPISVRIGPSWRQSAWPVVSTRSPSESRPSSPRSYGEGEGYNSADEQAPCYVSSYDDSVWYPERERLFELELRRAKGFEVKKMMEDGNCLFRAVADQVYGDPEAYDMTRQMCVDYMVMSTCRNIGKDQVKAAIKAQQDQQIDNVSNAGVCLQSSIASYIMVLSMGFGYMQVMEAYSIFGDDVDSMICYLLEMGGSGGSPAGRNRHKGKAAE
ncbi:hypothetical protein B296_00036734 [Ensete ventricosum]|uniref:ubiquitinyl hydrolase 1 n=1 Tax=Ensete ventricosum TaxID=4639 RepID=A0A426YXH7_ENSVE|nr:hypothetical protein B296_00036734 [Ensete ventricosum]